VLIRRILVVAVVSLFVLVPVADARQVEAKVQGVLFFSPTCGHCEYVIAEVLPPLFEAHGGPWEVSFDETPTDTGVAFYLLSNGTLEFLLVDVTVQAGFALFEGTTEAFAIGNEAVPRLVVADRVMIGSQAIPARLPALIDEGLAGAGIGWPDLPGVAGALETIPALGGASEPTTAPPPTTTTIAATTTVVVEGEIPTTEGVAVVPRFEDDSTAFGRDPVANTIAVLVLVGMVVAVGIVFTRRNQSPSPDLDVAVPVLAGLGAVIAGYLAVVEITASDAMCGPVGDCNTVQQSAYASVGGVPIGIVGVIGYLAAIAAWFVQRRVEGELADRARVALLAGTLVGVAFSAYLTFLEPFVIGATCAWCLASAVLVTMLMWVTAGPGIASWRRVRRAATAGSSELE